MSITVQQQLMLGKAGYRTLLEDVLAKVRQGDEKYKQLDCMAAVCNISIASSPPWSNKRSTGKTHRASIVTQTKPHLSGRTDLIHPLQNDEDEPEEVVLSLQGYLVVCNLPPITRRDQLPRNAIQAKQSITITGLGLSSFEVYSEAIIELFNVLSKDFPANSIQPWKPHSYEGDLALSFTNRYFSATNDEEKIPLPSAVDPLNILASTVPHGKYTSDNEVLYFEQLTNPHTQSIKHLPINPVAIHIGQLVELQVSFCVQPIGQRKYLFLSKLRSVCILNRVVEQDVTRSWLQSIKKPSHGINGKVKRRVGYSSIEDETEGSSARFKKLRLDDEESSMKVS